MLVRHWTTTSHQNCFTVPWYRCAQVSVLYPRDGHLSFSWSSIREYSDTQGCTVSEIIAMSRPASSNFFLHLCRLAHVGFFEGVFFALMNSQMWFFLFLSFLQTCFNTTLWVIDDGSFSVFCFSIHIALMHKHRRYWTCGLSPSPGL